MSQIRLTHTNANLKTLSEFANFFNIAISEKFTIKNFFDYNRELIFNQLNIKQKTEIAKELGKSETELTAEDLKEDMTLPCPCNLILDDKYMVYNLVVKNNSFQIPVTDTIAFQNSEIKKILQDPYFIPDEDKDEDNLYKKILPGIRVLGWFKALHYHDKEKNTSNNIDNIYSSVANFIDLSPYIQALSTSVSLNGGSFSISLPHIPLYTDYVAQNDMIPSILNSYGNVNKTDGQGEAVINAKQGNDLLASDEGGGLYVKSSIFQKDYFNWLIQPNDLIFIAFNAMDEVIDDNLSGKTWDMIALVDSVSFSKDANGNSGVNVSGRDLMKLITDDSRMFFPNSVSNGTNCVFDNTEAVLSGAGDFNGVMHINGKSNTNDAGELPVINGTLPVFAMEPNDYSIDFVIKAVVSKLANMRIVPDYLFTSWGDKRTKFSDLKPIVEPAQSNSKTTS